MALSRRRTCFIALSIGGAYLVWGLLLSIQPSFYPSEAEAKGATPAQYGFVFGIVHLTALVFTPVFTRYGSKIGPKVLYNLGGFAQAFAGLAFASLDLISNTAVFLGLSYFLRAIDGLASAASFGSMFSMLMELYPERVATVMGWAETAFGLGYIIGPALGSLLYEQGGFQLPFIFTGSLGLIFSVAVFFSIPSIKHDRRRELISETSEQSRNTLTFKDILQSSSLLIPYVENTVRLCCISAVEAMLEPHMKAKAGASQTQVGLAFLIIGLTYTVLTPLMGNICDRISHPISISMISNIGLCASLLLLGPAPVLSLDTSVPLIFTACAVLGSSMACSTVATFSRAHKAVMQQGYADDLKTYLLLSGSWAFSLYFGGFIGPTLGGILVEAIGFQSATAWYTLIEVLMLLLNCWEVGKEYMSSRRRSSQGYQSI